MTALAAPCRGGKISSSLTLPDATVCPDRPAALAAAQGDALYIIGGSELYHRAMPLADVLLVTHVHTTIADADRFFPLIDPAAWRETACEEYPADARNPYALTFCRYDRAAKSSAG